MLEQVAKPEAFVVWIAESMTFKRYLLHLTYSLQHCLKCYSWYYNDAHSFKNILKWLFLNILSFSPQVLKS